MRTMYILRTDDRPTTDDKRPTDLTFWKTSNGHISATGHPIHFMFGSWVGFSGRRIEWIYFRLDQIQDSAAAFLENFEWPYLWNELSDPLSWITEQLRRNTGENNVRGLIRLVTIYFISFENRNVKNVLHLRDRRFPRNSERLRIIWNRTRATDDDTTTPDGSFKVSGMKSQDAGDCHK